MAENIETTSTVWKQIADMWNSYFTPPSRISPQELEKYREWLKEMKKGKPLNALVLGATPELRDALSEFGYKVTIIDLNMEMIIAMTSLLKIRNQNEAVVKANWLDNPLQSGYFDIIVGDAVLPNIPWAKREKFLKEIKRLLKPKGVFVTRAFYVPRKKQYADVKNILEAFSEKEPTPGSAVELLLELQILAYDPKDHLGTVSKPKEIIQKIRGKNGFNFKSENLNKILDILRNFWFAKFSDKVWVYAYRDEEEKDYRKFFKIADVFRAKDHPYTELTPMYFLNVKEKS